MAKRFRAIAAGSDRVIRIRYQVRGSTIAEITESLSKNRPMKSNFWADYSWKLHGGNPNSAVLQYQFFTLSPRLASRPESAIRKRWNEYYSDTMRHEANHTRIEKASVRRMLKAGSRAELAKVHKFATILDNRYDKVTDHGRLEGCRIDFKGKKRDFTKVVDRYIRRIGEFEPK